MKRVPKRSIIPILFMCLLAKIQAQDISNPSISIEESRIQIGELLKDITRQSGADFSYNSRLIDANKQVGFSVKNATLKQTLDKLSKLIKVDYKIVEGQIVLIAAPKRPVKVTLSGFLSDKASGESLIGATVLIKDASIGAFTNEYGFYSLSLNPGAYHVRYSHIGYEKEEQAISLKTRLQKNVALPTKSFELPAVIIKPPLEDILNKYQLGEMEISPDEINNLPEFLGESGLVKGLQSFPGIQTRGDGTAFFYTRGGERDQNLVFVDDAPIYNPSHMFGIYSMVIPDFAKSIKVYKSDMPARVGDRLSSIVDIRTKDGNLNKFGMSGAISPFVNRFSLEAPLFKKKSSLLLTFRRSNFEWLYKRTSPDADIHFVDLQLKWNLRINDKNRLFFTTIYGGDFLQNVDPNTRERTGINWANLGATFRWNHIFNPKLFSNTTLYTGNYAYQLSIPPNYWKSDLAMLGLKSDFTHYISSKLETKFGFDIQGYFNTPGSLTLDTTISILPNVRPNYARKLVLYYQGEWKASPRIKLNAGLRWVRWANTGPATYFTFDENYEVVGSTTVEEGVYHTYQNLDPRLSIQFQVDKSSQLKFSYGNYHQYLQLISNSISPFTSLEVWLPANPNIRPQAGRQFALSFVKYLEKANLEISTAAYHKNLQNQIDYKDHATTLLNPYLEGELRFGKAETYGLEFLLKKDFRRLNAVIAYTYSRVFRDFDDLNEGVRYPALQDRPHDFSLRLSYQWTKRLFLSAYWTSFSGSPFTSPTGFYTFNGQTVPIYNERNNDRLPTYHRLDIALKFLLNKREDFPYQHNLTFSIYNALAHKNVSLMRFNKIQAQNNGLVVPADVLSDAELNITQVILGRFLPSLTYKFNF